MKLQARQYSPSHLTNFKETHRLKMLVSLFSLYVSYFTTLYVVSKVELFLNFG